jgi:3-oxoacyl-[acyl-carrier protein] reductase
MDLELQNKRAFITGSSRGLGYATALGLAMEGATVAINSRHPEGVQAAAQTLAADTGAEIVALVGDVTDPKACERLVAEAADKMGGLDLLVTNAGGPPSGSFESFDETTWQTALNLSFLNHVRLIRAALPFLRNSECASVLTVTSYSVKQPVPNLILSNSIRAATVGLTKTLALELGHEGIRFNSILPGWTETERVQELMAFRAQKSGTSVEEEIRNQAAASPFGRMARPEEFSNAAVFLLSPKASYITGVMLTIDGGMYLGTL